MKNRHAPYGEGRWASSSGSSFCGGVVASTGDAGDGWTDGWTDGWIDLVGSRIRNMCILAVDALIRFSHCTERVSYTETRVSHHKPRGAVICAPGRPTGRSTGHQARAVLLVSSPQDDDKGHIHLYDRPYPRHTHPHTHTTTNPQAHQTRTAPASFVMVDKSKRKRDFVARSPGRADCFSAHRQISVRQDAQTRKTVKFRRRGPDAAWSRHAAHNPAHTITACNLVPERH
jgi:hypothetical protein